MKIKLKKLNKLDARMRFRELLEGNEFIANGDRLNFADKADAAKLVDAYVAEGEPRELCEEQIAAGIVMFTPYQYEKTV